jgi:hypothetical protein
MVNYMKKEKSNPANSKDQVNMGYENTKKRANRDDQLDDRLETTETGFNEGPEEKKEDSAGLRAESGHITNAGDKDNTVKGDEIHKYGEEMENKERKRDILNDSDVTDGKK